MNRFGEKFGVKFGKDFAVIILNPTQPRVRGGIILCLFDVVVGA